MGGKSGSSAPPAPDYTPVAQADSAAAQQQYQLGQDQLQFSKDQFAKTWPYAQQYLESQTAATQAEQDAARNQQEFFDKTYKPIEQQFATEAANYNSPARANQNAGAAMADVANTFEQQRNTSLQQLESYGIDPSQTRFGALDLSSRIAQAASTAAAGTQSRLNTEATGLGMQGEAINVGRGYPSAIAQSYNTATNSGGSGISSANQTTQTATSGMTGSQGFFGLGNQAMGNQASAMNMGYNNALSGAQLATQQGSNTASGIGSLAGMGMMAAAMMI